MNKAIVKDKEITIKLIKYAHIYKKYRSAKYIDYNLDFAVFCGTEDLFNSLKYFEKDYILAAIESEINYLLDDIA